MTSNSPIDAPEPNRFSVKMRASARTATPDTSTSGTKPTGEMSPHGSTHISGAERIVEQDTIEETISDLTHRALTHPKGQPDDIYLSVHKISADDILHLQPLPRIVHQCSDVKSAYRVVEDILAGEGIADAQGAISRLTEIRNMRGAMVLDADSGERVDGAGDRGIRVTALDNDLPESEMRISESHRKPYYYEALTLATKVAHHPCIIAELCISDDPEYTTGYVATSTAYHRIENFKPYGSSQGGRIFLVRGSAQERKECFEYLENRPVIVHGIPLAHTVESSDVPTSPHAANLESSATRALERWESAGLRRRPALFESGQLAESLIGYPAMVPENAPLHVAAKIAATGEATENVPSKVTAEDTATNEAAETASAPSSMPPAPMRLFSSSNYLGLAEHPAITQAAIEAIRTYGFGSGGSRLTTGNTAAHVSAEKAVARFFGYQDAVAFATGYQANVSVISALAMLARDLGAAAAPLEIFSDSLNHASLIDGARMATKFGATITVFPHRDEASLRRALEASQAPRKLIISDGVFSMDGDVADLPALSRLARECGAWLLIDDAHGCGTLSASGRGIVEYFGCDTPDVLVITASKALGGEGAAVCCDHSVAEYVRNRARGYVFSTSAAPASVAAMEAAIHTIERKPDRVQRLQSNATLLRTLLIDEGVDLAQPAVSGAACEVIDPSNDCDSPPPTTTPEHFAPTPIIPILVGDEGVAMDVSHALRERGFHVPAIRYPTVARGKAILRVTVMATHSREQIRALVSAISEALSTRNAMSTVKSVNSANTRCEHCEHCERCEHCEHCEHGEHRDSAFRIAAVPHLS